MSPKSKITLKHSLQHVPSPMSKMLHKRISSQITKIIDCTYILYHTRKTIKISIKLILNSSFYIYFDSFKKSRDHKIIHSLIFADKMKVRVLNSSANEFGNEFTFY